MSFLYEKGICFLFQKKNLMFVKKKIEVFSFTDSVIRRKAHAFIHADFIKIAEVELLSLKEAI